MHVTLDVLSRFTTLPAEPERCRELLDDIGVEVKRFDPTAPGVALTLELLANRGDHHCYVGIARELRGRTAGPLHLPEVRPLEVGDSPHPLVLESALCPLYTLTLLERVGEGSLPAEATRLLESCGLRPVGPVVDATNVANLELGQPTHAFDADTIVGPITLRTSRPGEQAWPLFQEGRVTLPEGTLVVADDEKVLAIAGVIGCEESKTTERTTRVLLESAAFDPVAVRKASRALGVHTDSSARFERGADFSLPLVGAGRVCLLLEQAGWEVRGDSGQVGAWRDPRRTVRLHPAAARAFLGIDEDDARLADRLERYGFRLAPDPERDPVSGAPRHPGAFSVQVPPHRLWDVEHAADLYEELAKSIGYNDTAIGLPPVDMGAVPSPAERARERAAEVLVGLGFYEVITDGFHGKQQRERLGLTEGHPLWAHVETANALDRAYSLLKNQCLAQALDGVAMNLHARLEEIKAFELTRTFHPDPTAPNGVCTERQVLWAVASGHATTPTWAGPARPADAIFVKGVVEELARELGLPLTLDPDTAAHPLRGCLHPNRQLVVRLRGRVVGVMGEVHPSVLAAFKIKRARPVYLELELDALEAQGARAPYVEPPRTHPVVRNLAFTLPHRVEAGAIAAALRDAGPDWLTDVAIVDRFDHEEDGAPVRTWTFALTYSLEERDRTAEELNGATEALIGEVLRSFAPRGVKLR